MAKLKTGRHTSALKTHRQSLRRLLANRTLRKSARAAAKGVLGAVASKDKAKLPESLGQAASAWDKAAKKGSIHWKTAARKKSRLAAAANKILLAA